MHARASTKMHWASEALHAGNYQNARDLLLEALAERRDASVLYHLACAESLVCCLFFLVHFTFPNRNLLTIANICKNKSYEDETKRVDIFHKRLRLVSLQ